MFSVLSTINERTKTKKLWSSYCPNVFMGIQNSEIRSAT